jgi:hypothetical protein
MAFPWQWTERSQTWWCLRSCQGICWSSTQTLSILEDQLLIPWILLLHTYLWATVSCLLLNKCLIILMHKLRDWYQQPNATLYQMEQNRNQLTSLIVKATLSIETCWSHSFVCRKFGHRQLEKRGYQTKAYCPLVHFLLNYFPSPQSS